jgi:hypothetical protein
LAALSIAHAGAAPLKATYLAPSPGVPSISVELKAAPDMASYATAARARCEAFYPKAVKYLATEGYTAPTEFTFVFQERTGVAETTGLTISFAAPYFRQNPTDYGAAIHEMVHVIQGFPNNQPVWLTEGMTDYVRFYMYEPVSRRPHPTPRPDTYRRSYQDTAAFLAWAQAKYNKNLVRDLNAAFRESRYSDRLWVTETGKELDALGAEFYQFMLAQPKQ